MTGEEIIRLNYYERQFLGVNDFRAEQAYHVEMRRRHNVAHHTCGIVAGLELIEQPKEGGKGEVEIYIHPGIAVDGFGREIIVLTSQKLDPAMFQNVATDDHYEVWIGYSEELYKNPAYGYDNCGTANARTRVLESYKLYVGPRDTPEERHDSVIVEGNPVPNAELPQDESVPYQDLPTAGEDDLWLIRLGSAHWNGTMFVAAAADRLMEEREYVGAITSEVLAPGSSLLIRDRSTFTPIPAASEGVAVTLEGSLDIKRDLNVDRNARIEGDTIIVGKLGVGTSQPKSKVHLTGGTKATLAEGSGFVVVGLVNDENLVADGSTLMARDNGAAATLNLQPLGGDLLLHGSSASVGDRVVVTGAGNVGVGTTSPDVRLHVTGGIDTTLENGTGYIVVGNITGANVVLDDNEIMARNNGSTATLHLQADGGALQIHSNKNDLESKVIIWDDGSVGIGTTTPNAKLDVEGRIIRRGQEFSRTGIATHSQTISVPWGTVEDWNIFVSPREMGEEVDDDEGDNAVLMIQCSAAQNSNSSWLVTARYKFRYNNQDNSGNGTWKSGMANYLLVPR